MKKVVIGFLAIIGLLSLFAVAFVGCVGLLAVVGEESLPRRIVLEIDFEKGVIEDVPDDLFADLMLEGTPRLRDLVDAIDRGAEDSRVKGLVAKIGAGRMGMAQIQELRDAVARFRDAGKPAYAFAETFGEFGPGNGGYYLATAFEQIHLQPSGDIGLTGLIYETSFLRGLYEKLGITPLMSQRYEYKNAMNTYTDREYNDSFREAMEEIIGSQFGQIVRGVATTRGFSEEQARSLFDAGPFLGAEALDRGLVDGLAYWDEVLELIEENADKAERVSAQRYLELAGGLRRRGETIALIHGHGAVMRGRSSYSPLDGSVTMGSETIGAAFRDAIEDRRVKAIVFRVDSPGGSYVASDTIWRETVRAREANKPVVVSMGNLAGSGGYFVAMDADRIIAQPGTITASIGVFGGKLVTREFWKKLGITWDHVETSDHSSMFSPRFGYEGEAEGRFEASLDRIYQDFTGKVAAGRGLSVERVHEIAKGRIWTGEDALELGLVDQLGGLDTAFRVARELAALDPDAPIRVREFPRRRTQWEKMTDLYGIRGGAGVSGLLRSLRTVQPAARALREVGLYGNPGVLTLPGFDSTP